MGLTYVEAKVRAAGRRPRARSVRFLVDSGAVYSVLRRNDWRALGLKPERELEFVLADGTTLTRGVSECVFELEGRRGTSPVVLGQSEDEALLGAVTLETLGLMLNPLSRTLQPMRMVLARTRRGSPAPLLKLPLGRRPAWRTVTDNNCSVHQPLIQTAGGAPNRMSDFPSRLKSRTRTTAQSDGIVPTEP